MIIANSEKNQLIIRLENGKLLIKIKTNHESTNLSNLWDFQGFADNNVLLKIVYIFVI